MQVVMAVAVVGGLVWSAARAVRGWVRDVVDATGDVSPLDEMQLDRVRRRHLTSLPGGRR